MDTNLNFSDIIKKSVLKLDKLSNLSAVDIVVGLTISLLLGIFIFFVYRRASRSVVYNHSFNISLVLMCLLTTSIIMTISSNIVISLGMVGALSIVRYRTALKDPMDTMFMFWAIASGISTGAGLFPIAAITTLFVGAVLLALSSLRFKENTYLLVIHYNESAYDEVKKRLNRLKHTVRSQTVSKANIELTVELRISGNNTRFVSDFSEIEGVKDAILINYKGDYAS